MTNMDKITEELINENIALSKEVQKLKDEVVKSKDIDITCSFSIIEADGKPSIIRGVLLAEGLWKGVKFVYDNFKKVANMFVGIPLMKDHGHTKEFGNLKGGVVKRVIPNDTLKCLEFEAEVTDEDFKNIVKSGVVDAVSPKASWKVNDAVYPPEMIDCNEAIELSLTNSPVCTFCSIFNMEMSMFKENLNTEHATSVDMDDSKRKSEVNIFMSNDNKDTIDYKKIAEEVAKVNPSLKPEDILKIVKDNIPAPVVVDEASLIAKNKNETEALLASKGYISKADYETAITQLKEQLKPQPIDKEALITETIARMTPKAPEAKPDYAIPNPDLAVVGAELILGKPIDSKYAKKEVK